MVAQVRLTALVVESCSPVSCKTIYSELQCASSCPTTRAISQKRHWSATSTIGFYMRFFLAQHTAQHRTMPTPCQRIYLHSSSRYSGRLLLRVSFHEAKSIFLICQFYDCSQHERRVCVCVSRNHGSIPPCTMIESKKPLRASSIIHPNLSQHSSHSHIS